MKYFPEVLISFFENNGLESCIQDSRRKWMFGCNLWTTQLNFNVFYLIVVEYFPTNMCKVSRKTCSDSQPYNRMKKKKVEKSHKMGHISKKLLTESFPIYDLNWWDIFFINMHKTFIDIRSKLTIVKAMTHLWVTQRF